jgi:hypothetical protein
MVRKFRVTADVIGTRKLTEIRTNEKHMLPLLDDDDDDYNNNNLFVKHFKLNSKIFKFSAPLDYKVSVLPLKSNLNAHTSDLPCK